MRQLHVLCLSLGQVYHITRTTTVGARACPAGHAGPCLLLAPLCLCSPGWTALPALWAPNLCVVVYRMLSGTCPTRGARAQYTSSKLGTMLATASSVQRCVQKCTRIARVRSVISMAHCSRPFTVFLARVNVSACIDLVLTIQRA